MVILLVLLTIPVNVIVFLLVYWYSESRFDKKRIAVLVKVAIIHNYICQLISAWYKLKL